MKYWFERDAERDFQRSARVDSHNDSTVHEWYGALLGDLGRFDQALEKRTIEPRKVAEVLRQDELRLM